MNFILFLNLEPSPAWVAVQNYLLFIRDLGLLYIEC